MLGIEVAIVVIALIVLFLGVRTVRIVPQARVGIIQRLGNYQRSAESGVAIVWPFIDRMLPLLDMREQTLDTSLTSRDQVNSHLRMVLDEVTEKWGVRVNRVELKDIAPPKDIQIAMEKQMQAERQKRAAILTAEGEAQSAILRAEGSKKALILQSEGQKQAAILKSEGEAQALVTVQSAQAKAIELVFGAVNA